MKLLLISTFILVSIGLFGQDNKTLKSKSSETPLEVVSKIIEKGGSDKELAQAYEDVAVYFSRRKEYAKSEEYWGKARTLYVKLKDKNKLAYVDREIAKVQEAQNKIPAAISSYSRAQSNSVSRSYQELNNADLERLQATPASQKSIISKKISSAPAENKKERVEAYQQMAQVNMELNEPEAAVENLNKALKETSEPVEAVKIGEDLAKVYASNKEYEKAIVVQREVVEKAKETKDVKVVAQQMRNLSSKLIESDRKEEGIDALKETYDYAIDTRRTFEAKKSLELLVNEYIKEKKYDEALSAYARFMDVLETLIQADSSLVQAQVIQLHEDRISQLEKERELKDLLLAKKDILNYVLISSIVIICIFLIFIIRTLQSIKKKNKQIALQSLRREMNPHFIFNSLNSVNQFIAQNNELEANKYLSSYSKLMRNIMENSNKDFIPLSVELDQLKEYLDLEYLRFQDKFSYEINVDNSLDTDAILVPNMLIQPQLENSVWHGLRYKETKGLLKLSIFPDGDLLKIVIEDDGIGIENSQKLKTKHQRSHHSRGMTNTTERINLLNDIYRCRIAIDVEDKKGELRGVVVTITVPLTNKGEIQ